MDTKRIDARLTPLEPLREGGKESGAVAGKKGTTGKEDYSGEKLSCDKSSEKAQASDKLSGEKAKEDLCLSSGVLGGSFRYTEKIRKG